MTKRSGNGKSSITRHNKSGLHMARYWVETPTGRKRKTIYGKTRKEVAYRRGRKCGKHTLAGNPLLSVQD